jgi:hypothetical protein
MEWVGVGTTMEALEVVSMGYSYFHMDQMNMT